MHADDIHDSSWHRPAKIIKNMGVWGQRAVKRVSFRHCVIHSMLATAFKGCPSYNNLKRGHISDLQKWRGWEWNATLRNCVGLCLKNLPLGCSEIITDGFYVPANLINLSLEIARLRTLLILPQNKCLKVGEKRHRWQTKWKQRMVRFCRH